VLSSLGWPEGLVLLLLALFVVGPERLPSVARDAGSALRQVRRRVAALTADLSEELGPELAHLDLRSLQPKSLLARHLLEDPAAASVDATAPTQSTPSGVTRTSDRD